MLGEQLKYPNRYMQSEIYVSRNAEHDMEGVIRHSAENTAWKFYDVVSFLRIFEVLYNTAQFPQATHQLRDFGSREKNRKGLATLKDFETNDKLNSKPTFVINVQYRQNASWQGTINWVDEGKETSFRSTLELIKLMDDAIEGEKNRWD